MKKKALNILYLILLPCVVFLQYKAVSKFLLSQKYHQPTVKDFRLFAEKTGYKSSAEQFGNAYFMRSILKGGGEWRTGANYKYPDGKTPAKDTEVARQLSAMDALYYCEHVGMKIPNYAEYWEIVDEGADITRDWWDWTCTNRGDSKHLEMRLAGGTKLCNPLTCKGYERGTEKWLSGHTSNNYTAIICIKK